MWETLYKAQMWLMLETCVFLCYISLERQTKEIVFSQIEIITIVLIRNIIVSKSEGQAGEFMLSGVSVVK